MVLYHMEKKEKKYVIRESELAEIIKEMVINEIYNANDYAGMHTKDYAQKYGGKSPNVGDMASRVWNMVKGIPNAVISNDYKERVANSGAGNWNDIQRRFLDMLAANKAGTAGPDWIPGADTWFRKGASKPNANAEQQLNVNYAVDWLRDHAYRRYIKGVCGNCARYVRTALNAGGLDVPHGNSAKYARDYVRILPANGWQEIPMNSAGELCDVCVLEPFVDTYGKNHPAGHISMCIGNGVWASDFIQQNMFGIAGGVQAPQNVAHVYRYKNRV